MTNPRRGLNAVAAGDGGPKGEAPQAPSTDRCNPARENKDPAVYTAGSFDLRVA
jgi:hypothetical protein